VDQESVLRLRRVIGKLARQLNASATGEGLTPSQASVLGLVVARGPLGLGELARLEGLNPTMLSRVVGALDSLGLVRRMPDPNDLRSISVEATAAGRRSDQRVKTQRAEAMTACIEELPDQHVDHLLAALPALEALAMELQRESSGR
jgi:DNA-binding MarR family transcriptional regulator